MGEPTPHDWFKHPAFGFVSCRQCGIIKKPLGNRPCRGPVYVALRSADKNRGVKSNGQG